MKTKQKFLSLAIAALLSASPFAVAEDIELFNADPSLLLYDGKPNVLIILDNSANWNSNSQKWRDNDGNFIPQGRSEARALKAVINSLPVGSVNVGLMMFVKGPGNKGGGYLRFGIRLMDQPNKDALMKILEQLNIGGDDQVASADTDYSGAMFEAFKYFGGYGHWINGASVAGSPIDATHFGPAARMGTAGDCAKQSCGNDGLRDYFGNNTKLAQTGPDAHPAPDTATYSAGAAGATGQAALANKNATSYQGPDYSTNPCGDNYILFIGNGFPSQDDGSLLDNVGGVTTPLYSSSKPRQADEWARFLYEKADVSSYAGQQRVITYTVDVCKDACDPDQSALLSSMASDRAGRGRYFLATNENELNLAFSTFFNDVQAVNSVFASATLPVSVNVRGTNANQVYIGQFRPDKDSLPRWYGNLKLYELGLFYTNPTATPPTGPYLALTDARASKPAVVDTITGNFRPDTLSFWTTPNPALAADVNAGFWSFSPSGTPPTGYDAPDGAIVEKGAVAQILRNTYDTTTKQNTRTVYTCLTGSCKSSGTLTAFNTTNIASGTLDSNTVMWFRGQDNSKGWNEISGQDENRNGDYTDVRASIHGDVLHSRPAVVNYNRYSTSTTPNENDVVIFYGANDGLFRAVKGGYGPTNGISAGTELWSFVPEEFFPKIKRLRDNFPPITSASGLVTKTIASTGASASQALTFSPQPFGTLSAGMVATGTGIPSNTFVTGVTLDKTVPATPTITGVTLSQPLAAAITGESVTFTPTPKDYFMDGPIGVLTVDANSDGALKSADGDKVQLFIGMRRGGRMIYAMDVSNPASPTFMWMRDNSSSSDWAELGQTWSEPKVATINLAGTATKVLIFGAGYDPAYDDQDPVTDDNRSMGRGIFVVKASDGSIVWRAGGSGSTSGTYSPGTPYYKQTAGMDYPIPSDVALIDRNANGTVDRLYVGDTGGNLWRVDFGEASGTNTPDTWQVHRLATVGVAAETGGLDATKTKRRKFLYPPDVVASKDSVGAYDAVLIGSGDREHPFNGYGAARKHKLGDSYDDPGHPAANTVLNRFYMFKDRDVGLTNSDNTTQVVFDAGPPAVTASTSGAITEAQLADVTQSDTSSSTLTVKDSANNDRQLPNRGWYRSLVALSGTTEVPIGEKVVGGAVTLNNITFFNTNVANPPALNSCGSNLGDARQYEVNFQTGQAGYDLNNSGSVTSADLYNTLSNAGFLPSPVGVIVTINGKPYGTVLSGPNTIGGGPLNVGKKFRTHWYKRVDRK